MAADGSIVFRVDADDKDAQKKLNQLRKEIEKTSKAVEASETKRNGIADALKTARDEAAKTAKEIEEIRAEMEENQKYLSGQIGRPGDMDSEEYNARKQAQEEMAYELAQQEKLQASQQKNIAKLEEEDQKVLTTLQQQTQELQQQKAQAGDIERSFSQQSTSIMPQLKAATDQVSASMRKGFKNILKWGFGIRSTFILMRRLKAAIKEGVKAFAEQDAETKANIEGLKAALQTLKVSWGAAFAPIVNAVAPLLQRLIGWLIDAGNAIARFIAIIGGKSSYKKAITNNNALADSLGGVGSAAKEAKRQLMGFDELNVLDSDSGGGGGGGSSPAYELVEETIDALNGTFLDGLALTIKDVFFDWSDLNPEQIAEKAITGLCALLGGVSGFVFGGVPGAIIGTIAGIAISLLINTAIFDHDGQISKDEVAGMLRYALAAVVGGVIGFFVGGPGGALLGASIGLGVMLAIDAVRFKVAQNPERQKYRSGLDWFVCGVLHLPTDQEFKQWGINVINWIADGFKDFGHELDLIFIQPMKDIWADLQSLWADLKKWWQSLELGAFHIPRPVFSWTYSEATGAIAKALEFVGLPSTIPHLNIQWMARGGIVDGATLFGAGEAGREAIIPLEKNTGWIKKIAEELLSVMESKSYISDLPPVARGQLVPPGAAYGGFGEFGTDILQELKALRNEIYSLAQQPIEVSTGVNLDRREIGRAVTIYQRSAERMNG